MSITAASIEANGWVLRLTVTGSLGSFASYTLDPDGSPRLTLASSHTGYAQVSGQASATSLSRSLVATKPVRKPVSATNAGVVSASVVDETDLGGGNIQVRLALSQHVYATDTALAVTVLAGWRAGESAASAISVTNNSTIVAPVPIMRWADVPYQRRTSAFELAITVFSHHPNAVQPVAGVKFSVTDGTNTKTYWAIAPGISSSFGDALPCYRVTVDPATATALTAGLLRCDAEIYPWLGSMRSTDAAGTRSMTNLGTTGFGTAAQSPFTVAWDPAGTRYNPGTIFIDPVGGTTTASTVTIGTTLTAAKAGTAARDVSTAIQAGYLANKSLSAANGQAAQSRSVDGLIIVLKAATHAGAGTTTATSGITANECWPMVVGDPSDSDPRTNCVLQTATSVASRILRIRLANLAFEVGTTSLFSTATVYFWLDNVEVRGRAGQTTNTTYFTAGVPPAGQGSFWATATRHWKSGSAMRSSNGVRPILLRNCEFVRRTEACAILGGRVIQHLDSSVNWYTGANGEYATGAWGNQGTGTGDLGSQEDHIVFNADLRSLSNRAWRPGALAAATAGTSLDSYRRQVFANNVCERLASGTPEPMWSMGEDESAQMSYNIIEGNSFVGERCNALYSDPLPVTVADTDNLYNIAFVNRIANNSFDWLATKHDAFNDPQTLSVRSSGGDPRAHGYRSQGVQTWSVTYGVGWEGNYDFGRAGGGNFAAENFGLRSVQTTSGAPGYANDKSQYGAGGGQGDYRPALTSALIGRARSASAGVDRFGGVRIVPFASGGTDTPTPVTLVTAKASSASRAGSPLLGWAGVLLPNPARSTTLTGSPQLNWLTSLAPNGARHALRTGSPLLGWSGALVPAGTLQALRSAAPALTWNGALSPAGARSTTGGTVPGIGWGGALVPASAWSTLLTTDSRFGLALALSPTEGSIGQYAQPAVLTIDRPIAPDNGRHSLFSSAALTAWATAIGPAAGFIALAGALPFVGGFGMAGLGPHPSRIAVSSLSPGVLPGPGGRVRILTVGPDRRVLSIELS